MSTKTWNRRVTNCWSCYEALPKHEKGKFTGSSTISIWSSIGRYTVTFKSPCFVFVELGGKTNNIRFDAIVGQSTMIGVGIYAYELYFRLFVDGNLLTEIYRDTRQRAYLIHRWKKKPLITFSNVRVDANYKLVFFWSSLQWLIASWCKTLLIKKRRVLIASLPNANRWIAV